MAGHNDNLWHGGSRRQLVASAGPRAEVSVEDFRDAQRVHLALQRGVANPLTIKCMR